MEGIESKRRNRSVEENLAVWKKMVEGTPEGRKCCMRFKIDMKENNAALRDPVAYRCNDTAHWRTGTKYKARPFSVRGTTCEKAGPFTHSYHSAIKH